MNKGNQLCACIMARRPTWNFCCAVTASAGAQLYFYTAFNGETDFANGILQLQKKGCNIIVDDIAYLIEVTDGDKCTYLLARPRGEPVSPERVSTVL